ALQSAIESQNAVVPLPADDNGVLLVRLARPHEVVVGAAAEARVEAAKVRVEVVKAAPEVLAEPASEPLAQVASWHEPQGDRDIRLHLHDTKSQPQKDARPAA